MNPNTNITNITTTATVTPPVTATSATTGTMYATGGSFGGASRVTGMYSLGMIASTIDEFTGRDVVRYLEKFEQRAELDGWTEEEAIKLLKFRSTGEAHDLWASDPTLRGLDFKTLKDRLIARFSAHSLPGEIQLSLSRCYQRHDEGVASFCTRLRVLGSKLLKEDIKNATALEEPGIRKKNADLLLNQFKLGLRKEIMKEVGILLLREENLSLDKAEELVKLQETNMKVVQGRSQDRQVLRVNCYNCGKEGHIARECRRNEAKKLEEPDECFLCHRRGHWARECPKRNFQGQSAYRDKQSYATTGQNDLERQGREGLRYRSRSQRYGEFSERQADGPMKNLNEGTTTNTRNNDMFRRYNTSQEQGHIRTVNFDKKQEVRSMDAYEIDSGKRRGVNGNSRHGEDYRMKTKEDERRQVEFTDARKFVPNQIRNRSGGGMTSPNSLN